MADVQVLNPFAKRESHSKQQLLVYKVLTILTWLLVVIVSVACSFKSDDRRTIWGQNKAHPTPFSLNPFITDIYWVILLIFQGGYIWHLFSENPSWSNAAGNVGSHFIFNNIFHAAFIVLWAYGNFWIAELLLVLNFLNLVALYLRYPTTPRLIHIPVVSGPLAWTFVAIFWNGAAMVGAHHTPARILANIVVWAILVFGFLFLVAFKDYYIGFELSILSASLAVHQFGIQIIALQWIFAFVIMGVLFLTTLIFAAPEVFGDKGPRSQGGAGEDRERQPLLNDQ